HMTAFSSMRGHVEGFILRILNKLLYRRATVVAVSQSVKADLIENFGLPPQRVLVIPNAVNATEIARMASEVVTPPWGSTIPIVVAVGRLSPEKGHTYLIRAFAEVRRKMICQLAIMGTGELESELKQLVAELGLMQDVHFLGWQTNPFT